MFNNLSSNFIYLTIYFLWFAAIFDPIGNFFGFRYIALFLFLISLFIIIFFNKIKIYKNDIQFLFIIIFTFFIPIYGFFIYLYRAEWQDYSDTSYIASGLLMLTTLLYFNKNLCNFGLRVFIHLLRALSILIILIWMADIFNLNRDWFSLFTESNVALISFRIYSDVKFPYILFLASPMLIYLLGHDLYSLIRYINVKNLLFFVMSSWSFFLTGTRSHIIISIIFLPIFLLLFNFKKYSIIITLFFVFFIALLIFNTSLNFIVGEFFSTNEASNYIKINMFDIYISIFSDPFTLIFGQGFNAHTWSDLLRSITAIDYGATKTELTYLEILRVFGVPFGLIIILSLLHIIFKAYKISSPNKWIFPSLCIYLINASLNPYLFSTNGILPIALIIATIKYSR